MCWKIKLKKYFRKHFLKNSKDTREERKKSWKNNPGDSVCRHSRKVKEHKDEKIIGKNFKTKGHMFSRLKELNKMPKRINFFKHPYQDILQ